MIDINETVMQNDAKKMSKDLSQGNWIVLYHAHWCPHCYIHPYLKNLKNKFRKQKLPVKIANTYRTNPNEDSLGYSPKS